MWSGIASEVFLGIKAMKLRMSDAVDRFRKKKCDAKSCNQSKRDYNAKQIYKLKILNMQHIKCAGRMKGKKPLDD
jgi:hypothetical protein